MNPHLSVFAPLADAIARRASRACAGAIAALGLLLTGASPAGPAASNAPEHESGVAWVVWGDPAGRPRGTVERTLLLVRDDGSSISVDPPRDMSDVARVHGRRVVVDLPPTTAPSRRRQGRPQARRVRLSVEHAQADEAAPIAPPPPVQHWKNVLCRFPDIPVEPTGRDGVEQIFADAPPGLVAYWREVSYGRFSVDTETVGWLTLPKPKAAYIGDSVDLALLRDDCLAAAHLDGHMVPSPEITGFNLLFNSHLGNYGGFGGGYHTWVGSQDRLFAHTIAHEMGHAYGLPHSNDSDDDGWVYDDYWDVMSCGGCGGGIGFPPHPIAHHKMLLGLIPDAEVFAVPERGRFEIDVEQLALPARAGILAGVVPIDGMRRFLTVESRRHGGFDAYLVDAAGEKMGAGIVVHEVVPDRAEPAWLVQAPGETTDGGPGEVWTEGESLVVGDTRISVLGQTGAGFRVAVERSGAANAPCVESETVRCLRGGRFRAQASWRDLAALRSSARVVANRTGDSSLFSFYGPDNWEILLKVLDGCGDNGNGRYWVFAAAATTFDFAITVTDLIGGAARQHFHVGGRSADAITDVDAFATCP